MQGNNSRVHEAENQINDLEHMEAKNNHTEQEVKRIQKNEDGINSLWDNFKRSNIHSPHRAARRRRERAINWISI